MIVSDHKFAYLMSKNIAHSARAPCIARALKTARAARSIVRFLCCSHLQNYVTTKGKKVSGTTFILTHVNQRVNILILRKSKNKQTKRTNTK